MNFNSIPIVVAVLCVTILSCGQDQKDPDKQKVEEANASIQKDLGKFKPTSVNFQPSSHAGMLVTFSDNQFTIDSTTASIRPGRLPYTKSDAPFEVIYKSADGRILGQYRIPSPLLITSCDSGQAPVTKRLTSGKFELLLPNNTAINSIELRENGKSVANFRTGFMKNIRPISDTTIRQQ